jgi:acyl-CoA thioester hydrolase
MAGASNRPAPTQRDQYLRFTAVTPRWNDIDVFGHINNAEFYAFFDTAVMRFMVDASVVSVAGGEIGTLVAETGCRFHREVRFQDSISVGLRVASVGNSSVRYEIGVFANDSPTAAADGHLIHVFVDRSTKRPTRIPDAARALFQGLLS